MKINWGPERDLHIEGRSQEGRFWIRLSRDGSPDSGYLILPGSKIKKVAREECSVADLKQEIEDELSIFLFAQELGEDYLT
jgi:hypothetical protein